MKIWLVRDPERERIAVQNREIDDSNLPVGPRGRGWEIRELDAVDEYDFERIMEGICGGRITAEEMDELHQQWWEEAAS